VLKATEARRCDADPQADLDTASRHGIRLVVPESDDWPHFALAALEAAGSKRLVAYNRGATSRNESGEPMPPLALWVKGVADLATLGTRSVGIVGSRDATPYGEHVTAQFAYALAGRGVVVVSGGAHGIDAAAHRAALAAGGETVLVSAGGLDRPYPPANAALYDGAIGAGLVISESPPGCAPQRHRFLTRNRLIAALSTGVVVVEAAARSGAMNTAGHCIVLGRPLMAVPGPITSARSTGCHALIRREESPAQLVGSVDEVLAVVGSIGEGIDAEAPTPVSDVRAELDRLEPTVRQVFEGLLTRRFARPDEIAARSGVSALQVIRSLPSLELAGLAEVGEGGHRLAARFRTRT
jgi:DNA processing protein